MADSIELNGKTYPLAKMNRADWDEFAGHARRWSVNVARQAVADLPRDQQLEVLRAVAIHSPTIWALSPEAGTYQYTPEGGALVLWLGIRRANPALESERAAILAALAEHPSVLGG